MSRLNRILKGTAAVAAATLLLTGCAAEGGAGDTVSDATAKTVTAGKLTIATGEPAYAPWVLNDSPEKGEGFEAAVAYAVAAEMGYKAEDVVWVRDTFEGSIAPGPKDWDLNLQQFSVTDERKKAVDFSTPYYTSTQAVVAASGTKAATAKNVAELKDAVIGVTSGTTSLTVAKELINPTSEIQVFNNADDNVAALKAGNIDALVIDLPTAFFVRDVQLEGAGVIVGQLATVDDATVDHFSFVLPKGSALTADVDAALEKLRASGKLDELAKKWLADQGAPVLQ